MAKVLPTTIFPGYEVKAAGATVTADSIVIPRDAIPALADTEANATTGDGMEVFRAILVQVQSVIDGLGVNDKPTKMTISKQPPKFLNNGNWQETYITSSELVFDSTTATLASE